MNTYIFKGTILTLVTDCIEAETEEQAKEMWHAKHKNDSVYSMSIKRFTDGEGTFCDSLMDSMEEADADFFESWL